jgi:hypothetical protein
VDAAFEGLQGRAGVDAEVFGQQVADPAEFGAGAGRLPDQTEPTGEQLPAPFSVRRIRDGSA